MERDDLEDVGVDVRIMDWNDLAQDVDRWRILVNLLMNFRVP
jgi:hypothetical protein